MEKEFFVKKKLKKIKKQCKKNEFQMKNLYKVEENNK